MALQWVRLDTQFPSNPKILDLVADRRHQAVVAYISSLAQCGLHETDGFITKSWLPFIHANAKVAAQLVEARLWVPVPGGWQIPDWAEYQPTSETSRQRTEKARKAAAVRWAKRDAQATQLKAVNE